jgi:hypothetical protein
MIYLLIECCHCDNNFKRLYVNKRSVDTLMSHAFAEGWNRVYYNGYEKLFCPECSNLPNIVSFYRIGIINERQQQKY